MGQRHFRADCQKEASLSATHYEVLVLGGGINGRCALFHLLERGVKRVGLIERFGLDHQRGSSHSHSRVTRSAYVHASYVRLMQVAHGQEWPRLERAMGEQLIFPNAGCFFGPPGGRFEQYAEAVTQVGVDCDVLDLPEAQKRFPMFAFPTAMGAVHDRTAGVIAAQRTMSGLIRYAADRGASLHTHTRVLDIDPGRVIRLHTESQGEQGTFTCDRLIITAGPWTMALLPWLKPRLTVARQTVGYFRLRGEPSDFGVGRWPVWGNLGADHDVTYYGLPSFGRDGIKLARHVTHEVDDDPDEVPDEIAAEAIADLRRYLEAEFIPPVEEFLGAEHCHYTNTATEDFIIDLHPEDKRIAIGAGFSGHGFKFGPVTGRALAELVCDGAVQTPEFSAMRPAFAIATQ